MLANQILHFQGELKNLAVFGLAETHRSKRRRPVPYRVGVHREAVYVPTPLAILISPHDRFRPITPLGFAAPGAPTLVADTEVAHPIGSLVTVGGAFLGQRRRLRSGQILQPFGRFPRSTRADIN